MTRGRLVSETIRLGYDSPPRDPADARPQQLRWLEAEVDAAMHTPTRTPHATPSKPRDFQGEEAAAACEEREEECPTGEGQHLPPVVPPLALATADAGAVPVVCTDAQPCDVGR